MKKVFLLVFILSFAGGGIVQADTIKKETIKSQLKNRSYFVFVPDTVKKSVPAPVIVVLHGSGDSGQMPVKRWRDFAREQGIIIVGPNALDREMWRIPEDAPQFIYDMLELLKTQHNIDPRRVYLFGHSGGAIVALYLALIESEYFAAAAIHAGAMRPEDGYVIERTKRKIPFSLFVGTKDPLFPVADVRQTRDMLTSRGFDVEMHEIKDHTHDYGRRSDEINKMIWDFFKQHRLYNDPVYELYRW